MTAVAGFCPLFDAARQPLVSQIPDLRHIKPRRIEEKCLTAIVSEGRMSGKERQEFAKVSQHSSPIPWCKNVNKPPAAPLEEPFLPKRGGIIFLGFLLTTEVCNSRMCPTLLQRLDGDDRCGRLSVE
jgi:hypothetical protein